MFGLQNHSQDSNLCISKLVLVNFIVAQRAGSSVGRLRRFLRVQPAHLQDEIPFVDLLEWSLDHQEANLLVLRAV